MRSSSTFREILAVKFVLLSLVNQLSGLTRLNGLRTMKMYLGLFRLEVVKVICSPKLCLYLVSAVVSHGISIEMEWIPRSQNDQADFLSRIFDSDDWGLSPLSFHHIDSVWGPHFVESFRKSCECQTPSFQVNILESRF